MMTSAQVVETSVTTTDNSPSQDYTHPDHQTTLLRNPRVQTIYCDTYYVTALSWVQFG